ncbi:MAG: ATP-binding cassette domain-containing protein [Candidatus Bathyarchaeota archaeon]|nr:ATP-binding cassette domain-containing protein [Candidatus Bathyarchaeota archaeon]
MAIIEARNLSYTYPSADRPAFKNVNLKIERGEFILLTGPSGCGKTTLCRCFNGLIPHFYGGKLEGEMIVAGLRTVEHPIYELAQHVGLVFQNPENQLFALNVEKDVAFGLENLGYPRDEIRRRVDWALKVTGIYDLKDRPPFELSGGQKQRVAIASVLAMQPEVIVLDEPTSFLDPLGAKNILEVIHQLNEDLDITVILVEHRLDLAARFADRVIVMNDGEIVMDDEPRKVFLDDRVRLIGIGLPKVVKLYLLLRESGVDLGRIPLSPEETYEAVVEVLSRDRG